MQRPLIYRGAGSFSVLIFFSLLCMTLVAKYRSSLVSFTSHKQHDGAGVSIAICKYAQQQKLRQSVEKEVRLLYQRNTDFLPHYPSVG